MEIKRVLRIGVVISSLLLILTGCINPSEDDERDRIIQVSRSMVNDLAKARLDNKSMGDVEIEFNKHGDKIPATTWKNWFDLDNIVVRYTVTIAENYGYYPVDGKIDVINFGEELGKEGFTFTVVSTMKVKEESMQTDNKIRVYSYYEFNEEGSLVDYKQADRLMGEW